MQFHAKVMLYWYIAMMIVIAMTGWLIYCTVYFGTLIF